MSKKILSVIIALVVVIATFIPMTASAAVVTPVADPSQFHSVQDGWYIASNGGFKFNIGEWKFYGAYGLAIAESTITVPTNVCAINVYAADSEEVFENKTKADFETVLGESIITFTKTTVGNARYTMYYAETATYENYVFQASGHKYFINFIHGAGEKADLQAFAKGVMDSIVIADDLPEPIKYDLIYVVDGVEYAREAYEEGEAITPIAAPTKDGYTFSGWSEIPEVMPAETVTITGEFTQAPPTGDSTILAVAGAAAVLAFVVLVASKKRATAR
ncbi:MAG: InlB B-repeat-containing protein [Clostridia bacterium]|nr:InlB B-repeat-containing protein [Clostridia bacterium]